MKYLLKATDAEYTIEPSTSESWVLKEKTRAALSAIGIFKTPNEAAVAAGARRVVTSGRSGRNLSRRSWVLSSWEVCREG
jgi:hypothetical protein